MREPIAVVAVAAAQAPQLHAIELHVVDDRQSVQVALALELGGSHLLGGLQTAGRRGLHARR